ncbi:hypothetical protein C8R45DRAFT_1099637 [Mycena sanguinolenta]|nr:hypothetical protein C8R45DRAFT_1099637 [Mycena sanguinolenta]
MPAIEWATAPQKEYLLSMLPQYREVHATGKMAITTRFFVTLDSGWFSRFPTEAELGITPVIPGGPPLSEDELDAIGKATVDMKARLRAWMRYRAKDKASPAATVVKNSSVFKALQVRALVDMRGYRLLNEESEAERATNDGRVLTPEEEVQRELEAVERIKKNRAERMKLLRNAAIKLFAAESAEVLAEVEAAKDELNAGRVVEDDGNAGSQRTPEEYQHAIDQLGAVVQLVMGAIETEAGWHGMLGLGGPNPKRFGALIEPVFVAHEVRDQRALLPTSGATAASVPNGPQLEGMIPLESVDDNSSPEPVETTTDTSPPTATKVTSSAPKHVRRKKPVGVITTHPIAAAPDPVVAPSTPATPATPNLTLSIPVDFDQTMNDILSDYQGPEFLLDHGDPYAYMPNDWNDNAPLNSMGDSPSRLQPAESAIPVGCPPTIDVSRYHFPANDYSFPVIAHPPSNSLPLPTSFPPPSALTQAFTSNATVSPSSVPLATPHTTPLQGQINGVADPMTVPRTSTFAHISHVLPPTNSSALQSLRNSIADAHAVLVDSRARLELHEQNTPIAAAALTPTAPQTMTIPPTPLPTDNVPETSNANEIPQYPESRPMANPPSGHPLAPAKGRKGINVNAAPPKPRGRQRRVTTLPATNAGAPLAADVEAQALPAPAKRGRPRKAAATALVMLGAGAEAAAPPPASWSKAPTGAATEAEALPPPPPLNALPPLTGAAAQAESARIHRVERQLRADQDTNLQRSKEIDEQAAATAAEKKRLVAALHNPVVVIGRPRRAITALSNLDGSPIVFPVIKTRGDMSGVSLLGRRVQAGAANAAQEIEDAEMLERLQGSKAKQKGVSTQKARGTKRKATAAPDVPKKKTTK